MRMSSAKALLGYGVFMLAITTYPVLPWIDVCSRVS